MKRLPSPLSLHLLGLLGVAALLSGCGGISSIPDTSVRQMGVLPPIKGTVFGGHAPLVGAHVYLLQPGAGGLGNLATTLLGDTLHAPPGYPLFTNTVDPNIPVGWQFVVTDGNGAFSLSGGYACDATDASPVYIYAYGGAPTYAGVAGNTATTFNPAVVNLATLGNCPGSGSFVGVPQVTYVYMNEVSTVATAYAFQGFTVPGPNDAAHIGYYGGNSASQGALGIQNAAMNTFQLYDINGSVNTTVQVGEGHIANYRTYVPGTSSITGPNKGLGIVPQAVIDTLGNILAACVDSGNNVFSASAQCTALFATATADGTTTGQRPIDTATAAINIARHPAGVGNPSFVSTLFGIPSGAVPFTPNLAHAPNDFTVAIQYPSSLNSLMKGPQSIAVDAGGNFFFTTQPTAATTSGYLAKASPLGVILASSLNSSYTDSNVTVDSGGNAWVGTLSGYLAPSRELTSAGVIHSYGTGFTRAASPVADNSFASGNTYFVHGPTCPYPPGTCSGAYNNPMLTQVTSTGATGTNASISSSFSAGQYVTHAAIDSGGYIWMTSDASSTISKVNKTTGVILPGSIFPITTATSVPGCRIGGIGNPEQPAVDANGYAWIPIYGNAGLGTGVYRIDPTGNLCFYVATGSGPYGAAIDGANNVWIVNRTDATLTELNAAGVQLSTVNYAPEYQTTVGGVQTAVPLLSDPENVAIDISGDVFVTNFGGNSIVELIGAATPVYGPLGVAAGTNHLGNVP